MAGGAVRGQAEMHKSGGDQGLVDVQSSSLDSYSLAVLVKGRTRVKFHGLLISVLTVHVSGILSHQYLDTEPNLGKSPGSS